MKKTLNKLWVFTLSMITALCAFFGVLLISPHTVSADEAVATASTVDYSTWKKTQLNVGDTIYNKTIMMHLDIRETYPEYFFSTTSQGTCDTVKIFDAQVRTIYLSEGDSYMSLIESLRSENQDYLYVQMQATDSEFSWESEQINLDEAWFVFSFYEQSYTFQGAYEMCECETAHENADVWVDANDTITAIAEGVTLYELTEPIHANYDLTAVQTLDHDKYTQENAIIEETNFANAWIRLYNGLSNNVFLGGVDEGWSLNAGNDHQLFYSSADLKDVYYFKLPTVVTDEYVDVYIPSGTFTSAEKYELTIPTELYVDNMNYAQYETHVKVLSMPVYEVTVDFEMPNTVNYIESDVEYMDNIAGKYIRVYEGKDVWIYTSTSSIANMHSLCTNGVFKIISADGTYYDVTLPSNVGDGYVDVYIPIGTFTDGEYTFELIDTYLVGNYEEQLKVLTAPAEETLPDDENKPGIDLDGVGDWVNDKGDKISDWLKTEWGVAISGTSVIVIIVGAIVLFSIVGKKKR